MQELAEISPLTFSPVTPPPHSSGILLTRLNETWDFSSIYEVDEDPPGSAHENSIHERPLTSRREGYNGESACSPVNKSHLHSFSGFEDTNPLDQQRLQAIWRILEDSADDDEDDHVEDGSDGVEVCDLRVDEGSGISVEDLMEEQRPEATDVGIGPATRSRGRVLDLPNVQPFTLERKRKAK